jgi:regulator of RNase E activity RraA
VNHAQAMQGLSICDLSDACDALGIVPAKSGAIRAMYPGCPPLCGPVATCSMSPKGKIEIVIGTIELIDTAAPGSLMLIDASKHLDQNTIGSLVGVVAVQKRLAGAIIDGSVRDVQGLRELPFPVYARGTVVHSVRGRMGIDSINEPVTLGGTRVVSGDIAAADENGAIVFPAARAKEIFELAWRAVALEKKLFEGIRHGGDPITLHKAMKYDLSMKEQLDDKDLLK